jgi:hypothetical protein
LSGCSVKGFPQLEGDFHTPGQRGPAAGDDPVGSSDC